MTRRLDLARGFWAIALTVGLGACSQRVKSAYYSVALLLVTGCGLMPGGCEHTYREPVLQITRVTDMSTGQRIGIVYADSMTLDRRPLELRFGVVTGAPAFGVTTDSVSLTCTLPCGFGSSPGRYEFRLSAPNYTTARVAVNAAYATFDGGCPSYNDGGTRTSFTLRRS